MQLKLGDRIRELRRGDDRTQEAPADALGVTSQAVSRRESNGSYPDMELIPSIAHYFGVTIDELFGYESDRRIGEIVAKVDAYGIRARGDDEWVDECLAILRAGLAEFPRSERLMITLAETLSETGWRRHGEWLSYDYDDGGYIRHDYDVHKKNVYRTESLRLCETLAATSADHEIVSRAINIAVLLCRNFGECEKAAALARRMPEMKRCRELMLCAAADGREEARYIGEALLKMVREFAEQLVYGLVVNKHNYESDMPIHKLRGAIAVFDLLCDDGNYGDCGGTLIQLHLYLSRVLWERGYHDEAFAALDRAPEHARALEAILDGTEHSYTAPLVSLVRTTPGQPQSIAAGLPDDRPFRSNPDCSQVEAEIKADPRWEAWVARTREQPQAAM